MGLIQFTGNIANDVVRDEISTYQKLGFRLTGNQKSFIQYNYGKDMRMQVSDITIDSQIIPDNIGLPESQKGAIAASKV